MGGSEIEISNLFYTCENCLEDAASCRRHTPNNLGFCGILNLGNTAVLEVKLIKVKKLIDMRGQWDIEN